MSWDVMVFKFRGSPPQDFSGLPDDWKPDPLGEAASIRDIISGQLAGIDWTNTSWGIYEGGPFSIEFNLGQEDPIDSIMLHVRGSGDALTAILQFTKPNQWTLFDCSTGEFLDPANPSHDGWEAFQAFRNRSIPPSVDEH